MNRDARIFVAGHRGLIGSAIVERLREDGHNNLLLRGHGELDLENQQMVEEFFSEQKPEYVFLAAARVGGILANSTYPADFIYRNLLIQTNTIHAAYRARSKRLLFLGSSCIYPRLARQPIKEESLLSGPLELTNRPYAIAKISGIEMCWAYNRQYGTKFVAAMPTNLYGPGDNYDPYTAHVIPALIRRMHEAKVSGNDKVVVWGTGTPRREFLYNKDASDACIFLMNLPDQQFSLIATNEKAPPLVNIGCGDDLPIRQLAELVAEVVGFKNELIFDASKPDGTPRKLLDVSYLRSMGWRPRTLLREGLVKSYQHYCEQERRAQDALLADS